MATKVDGVTESPGGGMFTRKATGLVRSVSPTSTLIFNCFSAPAPFVLAIALFWTLGVFPGGSIYVALILGYVFGIVFCFAISTVTSALPRSGGDYVFVGRILHPLVGLVSSVCFTAGVLLSAAAITLFLVTGALAPSLSVIGLIGGSSTLADWGATLSTDKGWQFAVGAGFLLLCTLLAGSGWKWSLRVQNVGFVILGIGLLVTAIVVLLNSGSDFVSAFNKFSKPITGQSDSYGSIIAAADKAGGNVRPGSHFSNTWPMLGAVLGFSIYSFYSTHISGEVRQASTWRTSGVMVGATVINGVMIILMTIIFFHGFGTQFFTSINAINGSEAYPFAVPPFYVFLASIAGGSAFLAWVLGISIVVTFFVVLWLQLIQPMRALFAYAFDGFLPLKLAYVSPRSRVPVVSLGIVSAIILALYVWAVWGSSFFTVYATAVLFSVVALILMSVSVMAFAHRRPDLWRSSVVSKRIAGVPLTTLAGIPALLISILIGYLLLHYPGLGLTNRGEALRNVAIVVAGAIVLYFVADYVRGRQGVRLSQAASEIPPD